MLAAQTVPARRGFGAWTGLQRDLSRTLSAAIVINRCVCIGTGFISSTSRCGISSTVYPARELRRERLLCLHGVMSLARRCHWHLVLDLRGYRHERIIIDRLDGASRCTLRKLRLTAERLFYDLALNAFFAGCGHLLRLRSHVVDVQT